MRLRWREIGNNDRHRSLVLVLRRRRGRLRHRWHNHDGCAGKTRHLACRVAHCQASGRQSRHGSARRIHQNHGRWRELRLSGVGDGRRGRSRRRWRRGRCSPLRKQEMCPCQRCKDRRNAQRPNSMPIALFLSHRCILQPCCHIYIGAKRALPANNCVHLLQALALYGKSILV